MSKRAIIENEMIELITRFAEAMANEGVQKEYFKFKAASKTGPFGIGGYTRHFPNSIYHIGCVNNSDRISFDDLKKKVENTLPEIEIEYMQYNDDYMLKIVPNKLTQNTKESVS